MLQLHLDWQLLFLGTPSPRKTRALRNQPSRMSGSFSKPTMFTKFEMRTNLLPRAMLRRCIRAASCALTRSSTTARPRKSGPVAMSLSSMKPAASNLQTKSRSIPTWKTAMQSAFQRGWIRAQRSPPILRSGSQMA